MEDSEGSAWSADPLQWKKYNFSPFNTKALLTQTNPEYQRLALCSPTQIPPLLPKCIIRIISGFSLYITLSPIAILVIALSYIQKGGFQHEIRSQFI